MKLIQLDDITRVRPYNAIKNLIYSVNMGAFLYYLAGVQSTEYFTPAHTNLYCKLAAYLSTFCFTVGAGGLFGL
jgi:hypothetical protein